MTIIKDSKQYDLFTARGHVAFTAMAALHRHGDGVPHDGWRLTGLGEWRMVKVPTHHHPPTHYSTQTQNGQRDNWP